MTLCLQQTQVFVEENVEFKEKYRDLKKLGHGAYGVVYKANVHYNDENVDNRAIKIMCGRQKTDSKLEEIKRNLKICQDTYDNVVRYFSFNSYTHSNESNPRFL
jgi:serine/threonine protein kinase